jgi:hypothetical protein
MGGNAGSDLRMFPSEPRYVLSRGKFGENSPKNSSIEPLNLRKLKVLRLARRGNNDSFSWGRRLG